MVERARRLTPPPAPAMGMDRVAGELGVEVPDWRQESKCLGEDAELFFPQGSSVSARRQSEAAKAICQLCPVAEQCLDWALETSAGSDQPLDGIFGGLDRAERDNLQRALARKRFRKLNGLL